VAKLHKDQVATIAALAIGGESFSVLADSFGISRERVRQLVNKHCKDVNAEAFDLAESQVGPGTRLIDALRAMPERFVGRPTAATAAPAPVVEPTPPVWANPPGLREVAPGQAPAVLGEVLAEALAEPVPAAPVPRDELDQRDPFADA
jgi:hypothetical protein